MRTLIKGRVEVGTLLPRLVIALTPTLVVSTAPVRVNLADLRHDPGDAGTERAKGLFLNLSTTMDLVERYVTDWAGPEALVRGANVRLGVPACAGDTLTFDGAVASRDGDEVTVRVRGAVGAGDHACGAVRLAFPGC
ncbi:beta-hydroxyacyl-ACP dehydratase [Streptosporangium violaceochromogenes]|nr:beta-hydroxyacyl-ACP dehydratase [Streptosporangium violaceochromogenes]